uniref:beta-ketoacyl-ACP synthase 3 n=1 Tax=Chamaesiphon sp. VAR_48_metabat_135_sub TaxID=2964699 RepID=UPI00286CA7BE
SDEWISSRTGIRQRHISNANESLASLATQAAQQALDMAGVAATDVDMIILATSSSEDLFGTACQIQAQLGATKAVAFDLTAACSGFVFGMVTAAQFLRSGVYQNILVIGADLLSRWVDWRDRNTCVLFGDGAGAVLMQATENVDRLLGFEIRSDGTKNACLNLAFKPELSELIPGVVLTKGKYQYITMNGKEVYRFAIDRVPDAIDKVIHHANLTSDNIDWLILHQANQRIMDAVAERLHIPAEKVISNVAKYGNTSAASIPIALNEAVRSGKIKSGDTIATSGFGAGLSWGAAIFKWG